MSDEPKRTFTPREALAELLKDKPNNKIACLNMLAHEVEINEILQKHLEVIASGENDTETIEAVTEDGIKIYPFDNNAPTNQEEFREIETWIFERNFK